MIRKPLTTSAAALTDYSFVTIQNPACKPAKVCHSQIGGGTVYVNCVLVVGRDGKPNKKEMISFRAQNKEELKAAILDKHEASFSQTGTDEVAEVKSTLQSIREQVRPVTERELEESYAKLKRAFGAGTEITLEHCLRQGIREQVFEEIHRREAFKFAGMVTQEHRQIASQMTAQEVDSATASSVSAFVKESEWKKFFDDYFQKYGTNFLGMPDYTNRNYQTLIAYCDARGYEVPLFGELSEGMHYLLKHNHFYLQHTYPRTQRDALLRVRPFTGEIKQDATPVDERQQIKDATKGMNATQLKAQLGNERNNRKLTEGELRDRARRSQ